MLCKTVFGTQCAPFRLATPINKFAEDILGCWELVTLALGICSTPAERERE